jgi:IS30 family transposase
MDYTQFTSNPRKNKHLTLTERVKIELMTNDGKTPYVISKALNRPINTILGELKRGTVDQIKVGKTLKIYLADAGQARYKENRKGCCRKYQVLECDDFIKHIECEMLKNDWSVDSAVGRTVASGTFTKTLCTKTIYNYIDLGLMGIKNFHLPLKLRRKTKGSRIRKNKKILGDSIKDRPEHINNRQEFGHWEIDTVIGSKSKEDEVLLTLVERKTRNALVRKIPGKTTEAVMAEMERLKEDFGSMFAQVFKTITSDNGSEFASLATIDDEGTKVYFAHPYSSFERGTNERHNGLLRRFVPKGKKISDYSIEAILRLEEWINGLPRKIFAYRTPEELFDGELDLIYAL